MLVGLADFRPDVVHLHSYYGDLPYSFLSQVARRHPTVFTPHDPRPAGVFKVECYSCQRFSTCIRCPLETTLRRASVLFNRFFVSRMHKRCVHWLTAKRTPVVTPSEWLRERLRRTELARFEILHVPNGVDTEALRRIPDARVAFGLPSSAKVLLCLAGPFRTWETHPMKGLSVLARAFVDHVLPQCPDAVLLTVGEGLVPNHPNVRPMGAVPHGEIGRFFSAADVFVVPSVADHFPYTVLEAMACGVPVVASRVGGIPEQVEHEVTGLLVPPSDSAALGQAIVSLLAQPAKAVGMGMAGRERVEALFSMDAFVARYEEIYARLVSTKRDQ